MRYEAKTINFHFEYVEAHKGAHYTIDGSNFMNHGELIEIARKSVLGLEAKKDGNTPFDKGSDIEELKESVKSAKATLTTVKLGNDFETIKREFLKRVASEQFSWNEIKENILISYIMDIDEFAQFMDNFSYFDKDRKVIKFRTESKKMAEWFRERV